MSGLSAPKKFEVTRGNARRRPYNSRPADRALAGEINQLRGDPLAAGARGALINQAGAQRRAGIESRGANPPAAAIIAAALHLRAAAASYAPRDEPAPGRN